MPHQKRIDRGRRRTPFGDSPNNEALSSGHIPTDKDAGLRGQPVSVALHRPSFSEFKTEFLNKCALFWACKSHSQENKLGGDLLGAAGFISKMGKAARGYRSLVVEEAQEVFRSG